MDLFQRTQSKKQNLEEQTSNQQIRKRQNQVVENLDSREGEKRSGNEVTSRARSPASNIDRRLSNRSAYVRRK